MNNMRFWFGLRNGLIASLILWAVIILSIRFVLADNIPIEVKKYERKYDTTCIFSKKECLR